VPKYFCPKCGKEVNQLIKNLCRECFLESFTIKLPKIILKKCKVCGKYYDKRFLGEKEEFIEIELKKILKNLDVKEVNYWLNNFLHLKLLFKVEDFQLEKEIEVELKEEKGICRYCSLRLSNYWEAILQIRGRKGEILKEIEEILKKEKHKLAFISRVVELKNGFDIYLGSKKIARKIAKKFEKEAELKITRKFYGFKQGRRIYKDTILVDFKYGKKKE